LLFASSAWSLNVKRLPLTSALFSLIALGAVVALPAHALTCIKPSAYRYMSDGERLRDRMRYADAVFAGRFVEAESQGEYQISRFEVLRVWKGRVIQVEAVKYSTAFGDAPTYSPGEIYLVFASGKSGDFQNNIEECDDTIRITTRAGKLQYPDGLGWGRAPRSER
jgi:hypothetical protein